MKKIIATTTINAPTEAIRKYDAMEDWELLVVGDKATPDIEWKDINGYYMNWAEQLHNYPDLCELIGWNSVARGRMIAWIEAYKRGADILASIDDDCVPMDGWGNDVYVGLNMPRVLQYRVKEIAFDPNRCEYAGVPHRGFPVELYPWQRLSDYEHEPIKPLVQENLCHGQGDVDATMRFVECVPIEMPTEPFWSSAFSPINTQNTFIHRSAIKDFPANIPFIGRADDIWAGYIFQALHPNSTIYCAPTAVHQQDRSIQSIVDDLENEIFMYRNTYKFLKALKEYDDPWKAVWEFMPVMSVEAIDLYRSYFDD